MVDSPTPANDPPAPEANTSKESLEHEGMDRGLKPELSAQEVEALKSKSELSDREVKYLRYTGMERLDRELMQLLNIDQPPALYEIPPRVQQILDTQKEKGPENPMSDEDYNILATFYRQQHQRYGVAQYGFTVDENGYTSKQDDEARTYLKNGILQYLNSANVPQGKKEGNYAIFIPPLIAPAERDMAEMLSGKAPALGEVPARIQEIFDFFKKNSIVAHIDETKFLLLEQYYYQQRAKYGKTDFHGDIAAQKKAKKHLYTILDYLNPALDERNKPNIYLENNYLNPSA